jgi:lysyl-tRNA synthetase class I
MSGGVGMNIKSELKYAVGMAERRVVEASTIGKAESARQAEATYRSMTACVREVKKHQNNILNAIEDSTAMEAKQVMSLLVTVTDWQYRAGEDLKRFGVSQEQVDRIAGEVLR